MFWDILLMGVVVIGLVLLWICIYDSNRFVVVKYQIRNKKIRGHYRAVVISDLHNKQYGKDNKLLLEEIDKCKPDGIWVAGDILTAVPGKGLEPAIAFMKALSEKYPVFYGNGNHEHRLKLYPEKYGDMAKNYAKGLAEAGIEPLVNSFREIGDHNISVWGAQIDRRFYKRFQTPVMGDSYLEETLGKAKEDTFCVLIAHNPDYFPAYAAWGADLVLSGHVHGGMVRLPGWKGVASPSLRLFPKYDGGKFVSGDSTMLLSRGLGLHTIPVRLFNPGELLVVELEGTKDKEI